MQWSEEHRLVVDKAEGGIMIDRMPGDELPASKPLLVPEDGVQWLAAALHREARYRPERVLVVLDAKDFTDMLDRPGWRSLVDSSDLVVAVSGLGRPAVLKSRLPDTVEVGVLRAK